MLSDAAARSAKPKKTQYSISDIRGLHLFIMPTGRKYFRFRYTNGEGKRSWYTIGEYPNTTLADARARVPELRQRLNDGLPIEDKPTADTTFRAVSDEWLRNNAEPSLAPVTVHRLRDKLARLICPFIGDMEITKITPQNVLAIIQRHADIGQYATGESLRSIISRVFRYAAIKGIVMYDPASTVRGAFKSPPTKHHPFLRKPSEIGKLLRAVDTYPHKQVRLAALFIIYTFCRHGEMINAEWSEIDFEATEWRVPAEKMKKRRPHVVPLSNQVMEMLETMRPISGHGRYIFPFNQHKLLNPNKRMCANNVNYLLQKVGYPKEIVTPHGFRSMASTILNERGFNSDWIERQLAHVEGNKVRDTYNYADYLADRKTMIQWYADYLDELRGGPMNLG